MTYIEEWRWDLQEQIAKMTPNTPQINSIIYQLKRKIDGEDMSDLHEKQDGLFEREYIITATKEEHLNMLDKLFYHIQYLGRVGSSRKIELYIDGDGQVNIRFYKKEPQGGYWKLSQKKTEELPLGYGIIKNKNNEVKYFDLG